MTDRIFRALARAVERQRNGSAPKTVIADLLVEIADIVRDRPPSKLNGRDGKPVKVFDTIWHNNLPGPPV
jgi:hypothetical protein